MYERKPHLHCTALRFQAYIDQQAMEALPEAIRDLETPDLRRVVAVLRHLSKQADGPFQITRMELYALVAKDADTVRRCLDQLFEHGLLAIIRPSQPGVAGGPVFDFSEQSLQDPPHTIRFLSGLR